MRVIIRTDSSALIGTGHLMRCLTLAERLRSEGCTVLFVCRDLPGNISHLVEQKDFTLASLSAAVHPEAGRGYDAWLAVDGSQDANETIGVIGDSEVDWLIVDHYGIDARWEKTLRPYAANLMVIDDLANRMHDCDLLTEQNYRADAARRYAGLTPGSCRHMIGPEFALLQPAFARLRESVEPRTELRTILVFYGGIDATNETGRALDVLEGFRDFHGAIDVVVGSANTRRKQIERRCDQMETSRFHCQTDSMAELMQRADLALGAGGVTSWERCCLGLPSIITAVADNQEDIAMAVADQGAAWYAGTAKDVTSERLCVLLQKAMTSPASLTAASRAALSLGDGRGTERVASAMLQVCEERVMLL